MSQNVVVGISDLNVAKNGDILVTYALGSCIGICLYDEAVKVAGLSHIMLPTSEGFNPQGKEIWKFADTAIPDLIKKMEQLGANKFRIKAKIAGGAQMFPGFNNTSLSSIGERNIVAVKETLKQLRIPILAEDVGKDYGRTQFFDSATGQMKIKAALRGEWVY